MLAIDFLFLLSAFSYGIGQFFCYIKPKRLLRPYHNDKAPPQVAEVTALRWFKGF